jgi:phage/plasmid-associated DNA primase
MAGNKFLDYKESNGNVSRRVAAVHYQRYLPADQQDGDLDTTIVKEELPAIIRRCNQLYLRQARENDGKGIWNLLPEYYTAIRHTAPESVNAA